ncbi:hypothetical protein R3P38DRAFT_2778691 [Favolaschia claudopus]|uniref:Uncharacterized protein n=1 Tax=Favolaschia claudopus TaxID=2862362 RepID=A0AAW0BFI8_9AGAR
MYGSRQSTRSAYFDFYKTTPHQANLYRHNYIRLSSYKEHQCLIAGKGVGLQKAARNEAFEQHYKAICLAGKSEGIEALKQDTDLNTAFERKSVVPQSTGIHGSVGGIHSVVGVIHSSSISSPGIRGLIPSYLTREFCAEFLPTGPENSGILGEIDSVGGNSGRIISNTPQMPADCGILGD